ncbi:NAD(P)/FAD-dependent oxidoreductase [Faecalibaculum rodentium]|nr:NAD(P)/FAD-dependent oxidoreductase [Faecalibaculum rodentium]
MAVLYRSALGNSSLARPFKICHLPGCCPEASGWTLSVRKRISFKSIFIVRLSKSCERRIPFMEKFDVLIAGGGVTGAAIAWQLARLDLKVALLEKEEDISEGTTKANSGIVHAGYDAMPGTLKARLNVRGNEMIHEMADVLNFDFNNTGSLVICFDEEHRPALEELYQRGLSNHVPGLRIVEKEELHEMEPELSDQAVCALYAPTAGVVDPFTLAISMAENAADNGVEFFFNTPVETIEKTETGWLVNGEFETKLFVNAAGLEADDLHNMVCEEKIHIRPRRGEYFLFDKDAGKMASHVLFQQPTAAGKGVLITPTAHGNLMIGPTADFTETKEDINTTAEGLAQVREKASMTIDHLPFNQVITSFAGLRAVPEGGDFIIGENADGFIDAAGIESPGLTSAPAIGEMVAEIIISKLHPGPNENYKPERRGFVNVNDLSREEWKALIEQDPAYGQMVCRCEKVTEGSIKDACSRSIPARSLDGVKRRVRAGMGRCQSGFCSPRTMEIISETLNIPFDEVTKSTKGSKIITGRNKEDIQ